MQLSLTEESLKLTYCDAVCQWKGTCKRSRQMDPRDDDRVYIYFVKVPQVVDGECSAYVKA